MHDQKSPNRGKRPGGRSAPAVLRVLAIMLALCLATACVSFGTTPPDAPTPAPHDTIVLVNGLALAPLDAPETVATMFVAANELVGLPYKDGGGHRPYDELPLDDGYDDSGAISYVLHVADLLAAPLSVEQLEDFGEPDQGAWVTIVVCDTGAHMIIAGAKFDVYPVTWSAAQEHYGAAWSHETAAPLNCIARHPDGL